MQRWTNSVIGAPKHTTARFLFHLAKFQPRRRLAILDFRKGDVADIIIEVDRPLFTFTFTYKITDRANGILLSTGEVTAFDGNIAAPMLRSRIIKDIKKARGETSKK